MTPRGEGLDRRRHRAPNVETPHRGKVSVPSGGGGQGVKGCPRLGSAPPVPALGAAEAQRRAGRGSRLRAPRGHEHCYLDLEAFQCCTYKERFRFFL